jgi:hypothetical protein
VHRRGAVVLLLPAAGARGAGRAAEPDHAVGVLEGGRHTGVGLCRRRQAHRVQEDHGVLPRPRAGRDQDQVEDERVQVSRGRGRRRRRGPTTEPYSPGNDSMPTGRKIPSHHFAIICRRTSRAGSCYLLRCETCINYRLHVCFCRFGASSAYAASTPSPVTRGSSTAGREQQPRPQAVAARTRWCRPPRLRWLTWRRRVGRGKGLHKTMARFVATTEMAAAAAVPGSCRRHRKQAQKRGSSTALMTGQNTWTGFDAGNSFHDRDRANK